MRVIFEPKFVCEHLAKFSIASFPGTSLGEKFARSVSDVKARVWPGVKATSYSKLETAMLSMRTN